MLRVCFILQSFNNISSAIIIVNLRHGILTISWYTPLDAAKGETGAAALASASACALIRRDARQAARLLGQVFYISRIVSQTSEARAPIGHVRIKLPHSTQKHLPKTQVGQRQFSVYSGRRNSAPKATALLCSIHLFQSPERLELLNDIDRFRQHGLANLPQIVVCGDTSSGKSSVLGAISGIGFPVSSTICTRFATEIALRYSNDDTVSGRAFISPAPNSPEAHCSRVKSFDKAIASLEAIPEIMQEAQNAMGLGNDAGISRDVLHLRLQGRLLPNLTLVDLPGLIHASEDTNDIRKVQELVEYYFNQQESIILIVVSAENPINNQGILTSSRRFDPTGARSIGVITKPDQAQRSDKIGLLPAIISLAKNQNNTYKFRRPWHIVRCLNDDERSRGVDREILEQELFSRDPWDEFDRSQLGIRSLRSELSQYLQEHIISVLPQLMESLEGKIARVKRELEALGPPRAARAELMQYLVKISGQYSSLVDDALSGDYTDPFFQRKSSNTRLRATTMAKTDAFETAMRTQGHTFEVTRMPFAFSSPLSRTQKITESDALIKVGKLLESHRGPELSFLFNPRLVGELFKEQSQNWPAMASTYTKEICQAVRAFLRKVVEHICPKTGETSERILRHVF
ncbi:hypothetical protein PV05_05684 [Exophiala xenobiotica]|uniref:Dynamin-type G domain-containing protein n=1 Tax=Exophiala xenobiotica TaxID=348802 RepID=A0A0D2ENP7_9EURO|nr:uncharacterized protein PV05_05684 [Exophiala xenobiotica]KIW57083.1 hypothetical protein PV05_05684 [Exophiala xenobiotica]